MSQENQVAPIFILSCERSGSTLLRYIFDTHPQVSSPAHLHLGQLCSSLYKTVYYSIGQTMSAADEATRERLVAAEVRRIVDDLMGRYAKTKGKRVWCEKTTENLQYLKILTDVFPDARYICLYRNCMDVTHSTMECVKLGVMPELASSYVQKHPRNIVAAMVDNWIEKTTMLLEFELAHVRQCLRLKYESLVLDPIETLRAMFVALDLDWHEKLLSAVFSTEHDQGPGDKKILFTKKISAGSIGRGSTLSREQIPAALLDKMNELLARLDYPIVGPDWAFSPSPYLPAESKQKTLAAIGGVEEVFDNYIPQRLQKQRAGL
jgi:protein-tyrosine sulfotransferase